MRRKTIVAVTVAAALAAAGGGAAFTFASGDDGDATISRAQADRAIAAALRATGGGTANAVEQDAEDGATYEVEVTKPHGATVDVRLDTGYRVVAVDGDSEQADSGK
jgi:hypothetical protein